MIISALLMVSFANYYFTHRADIAATQAKLYNKKSKDNPENVTVNHHKRETALL